MNNEAIKVGVATYNVANGSCSLHLFDGGTATVDQWLNCQGSGPSAWSIMW